MNEPVQLDPEKIIETIERLDNRITDRFPDSGLGKTCKNFLSIARETRKKIDWISTPNIPLRVFSYLLIVLGLAGIVYSLTLIDLEISNTKLSNIVMLTESVFNEIILVGAAIFFLVTFESKIKRRRALKQLNAFRVTAHVIDMHQLTKDPGMVNGQSKRTKNSPRRSLTSFQLARYLDYCSELSSLVAKVAALYAQNLPDQVIVSSVNDIETLCTGLSRKIWQKLNILNEKKRLEMIKKV